MQELNRCINILYSGNGGIDQQSKVNNAADYIDHSKRRDN